MQNNVVLHFPSCADNEESIHGSFSISAKNMLDNSYVNGGKYELVDKDKNVVKTFTLDNGTINFTDIPYGVYSIRETLAPDGYICDEKEKQLVIDSDFFEHIFVYTSTSRYTMPQSMRMKFYSRENEQYMGQYNAVRIGEYYWVDQNFSHFIPWGNDFENSNPMTQGILDKYVQRVLIDPKFFQVDINTFEQYYGRYYSYPSVLYMNQYGEMHNEFNLKVSGWRLPYAEDYRQLFAMCPFNLTADSYHEYLNERDVRFALGAKSGDNPMAFDINSGDGTPYKTYWFDAKNVTNKYKFNLMPGGARLNGDGRWCNGLGPDEGCYNDGKKGDIYQLFYAAILATVNPKDALSIENVIIHDYLFTESNHSYHLMNVRWCRPLTDNELGYKLYINSDLTDVKKLDLNVAPPSGYKEFPHGYMRGFYVQYILDKPDSKITVADIVRYARQVEDNLIFNNRDYRGIL
ncbi:MAG: collagen binding domain-containing protein [Dysgonomonas sp.]